MTITKIIETDCAVPYVKTVELYVDGTVNFANFGADTTQNTADDEVILNYMSNGAPWAANQIDISAFLEKIGVASLGDVDETQELTINPTFTMQENGWPDILNSMHDSGGNSNDPSSIGSVLL